jgi:hypothetical protein
MGLGRMTDESTPSDNGKPLIGKKFIQGLPTALIYAVIALIAGGLAASAGFLPVIINTQSTAGLLGAVVFLVELISFL